MRHALVVSDWWASILVDATADRPNLDSPANVATLRRLASRYDVVVVVEPEWHRVGSQVRDRLRAYAAGLGRRLVVLRYVGSLSLRWGDQSGAMSIVPVARAVSPDGTVRRPSWTMRTSAGQSLRSVVMGGRSHLLDPGNPELVHTAAAHLAGLAKSWDGVFVDELNPTYHRLQLPAGEVDPRYPLDGAGFSPAYEAAKRALLGKVTRRLAAEGKVVGANIVPRSTRTGFFPEVLVSENPGLTHPFIEVFGTTWEGAAVGSASWDYPTLARTMQWLRDCEGRGRTPIVNAYSAEPATLRYALALFLAASNGSAAFSGNRPGASDEYSTQPTWLPDYEVAARLGPPLAPARGTDVITRSFSRGFIAANAGTVATTLALPGSYRAAGERGETVSRVVPPLTAAVLEGQRFGIAPPGTVQTPGALKLVGGRWSLPAAARSRRN